jgi:hypothetical protein
MFWKLSMVTKKVSKLKRIFPPLFCCSWIRDLGSEVRDGKQKSGSGETSWIHNTGRNLTESPPPPDVTVIVFWTSVADRWPWGGSGSADPCLWSMYPVSDTDPDPGYGSCYFRHGPSRCQQKTNFLTQFLLLLYLFITFWSKIYIIFQRKKVKVTK